MLDRIPMDVIRMPAEIVIVPDQVLPKSALPNATFTPLSPALRNPFAFFHPTGELAFDQTSTARKIRITGRERPNAMEMVRQNDYRFQPEGVLLLNPPKYGAQEINLLDSKSISSPLGKIHGKKPCASRQPGTTVFGHRRASLTGLFFTRAMRFPSFTASYGE